MKQLVRNVKISGTGSYVPETIITNEYLETIIETNSKWVFDNVGILERRVASAHQATSDLATIAGQRAIDDAGLKSEDIDLIIVATSTPDRKAPSTAAFVQHKLNAYNAAAFDLSNAGAYDAQELGYALAWGNQYLSMMVEAGVETSIAAKKIK